MCCNVGFFQGTPLSYEGISMILWNRTQLWLKLWSASPNRHLRVLTQLCQGCDIISMSLGIADLLPTYHPLSPTLSGVAIPARATSPAQSIATTYFFTMALHCHLYKFRLMTLQNRSHRTCIYLLVLHCLCRRRNSMYFRNFIICHSLFWSFIISATWHSIYLQPGEIRDQI